MVWRNGERVAAEPKDRPLALPSPRQHPTGPQIPPRPPLHSQTPTTRPQLPLLCWQPDTALRSCRGVYTVKSVSRTLRECKGPCSCTWERHGGKGRVPHITRARAHAGAGAVTASHDHAGQQSVRARSGGQQGQVGAPPAPRPLAGAASRSTSPAAAVAADRRIS